MAGKTEVERRAIEEADVDALVCAALQADLRVLLEEAVANGNTPRYERLIRMYRTIEQLRQRVVARKQGGAECA